MSSISTTNEKERVRATHHEYLDTLYANKVFQYHLEKYRRYVFQSYVAAEILMVVSGASGLGAALKNSDFGWVALVAGGAAAVLSRAIRVGNWQKWAKEAEERLAAYSALTLIYKQMVDDLNASQRWSPEFEKRFRDAQSTERKVVAPSTLPTLPLDLRRQMQSVVEGETNYKRWWRPYNAVSNHVEPDSSSAS